MRKKFRINLRRLSRIRLGRVSLYTLGGFLIAILGIFYFVIVNVNANKGFTLRSLEREVETLQGENERLAVEAARLKSLVVIDQNASTSVDILAPENKEGESSEEKSKEISLKPKMVPIDYVQYLPTPAGPLASRE